MTALLMDIGNSRLKWGVLDDHAIRRTGHISQQKIREQRPLFCHSDPYNMVEFTFFKIVDFRSALNQSSLSNDIKGYSKIFQLTMKRLTKILGNFPYNMILHTAPLRRRKKKGYWETIEEDYHWHIEIMPRLTRVAGFEWGSGFYINPVPPEEACRYLKETNNVPA